MSVKQGVCWKLCRELKMESSLSPRSGLTVTLQPLQPHCSLLPHKHRVRNQQSVNVPPMLLLHLRSVRIPEIPQPPSPARVWEFLRFAHRFLDVWQEDCQASGYPSYFKNTFANALCITRTECQRLLQHNQHGLHVLRSGSGCVHALRARLEKAERPLARLLPGRFKFTVYMLSSGTVQGLYV